MKSVMAARWSVAPATTKLCHSALWKRRLRQMKKITPAGIGDPAGDDQPHRRFGQRLDRQRVRYRKPLQPIAR